MHWMRNLCEHMPHRRLRNERRQIRSSQSRRVPHFQSLRSTVSFRCHSSNRVSSHFYSHFTCCIRRSLLRELRLSYFLYLTIQARIMAVLILETVCSRTRLLSRFVFSPFF